jgi:hypothetical protein
MQEAFRSPVATRQRVRGANLAPLRWIAGSLTAIALILSVVEGSLRLVEQGQYGRLAGFDPLSGLKWSPGSHWQGRTINSRGYWDDEFASRPRAGKFRVAALGGALTLSGTGDTNCLDRVERSVPGLDVFNFGLRQAGPREFVSQTALDVLEHRPDLVLLFIGVGSNDTAPSSVVAASAWRDLRVVHYGMQLLRTAGSSRDATDTHSNDPYERRLRRGVKQLDACRVPESATRKDQWRAAAEHLDHVINQCCRRDIELALVVVPADFQLSASLRDALVRRSGGQASEYDFELPQRRWARFAHERGVAVLDLLPSLRAARASVYLPDAADFSQQGLELASAALGDWLRARYEPAINATAQAALTPTGAE